MDVLEFAEENGDEIGHIILGTMTDKEMALAIADKLIRAELRIQALEIQMNISNTNT
jgi:hypothetical protein